MSAYLKLATLEYPRYEGDIRNEYPEITEDQTGLNFPCPDTYALVEWLDPPFYIPNVQYIYQDPPQLIEGKWVMIWQVGEYTQNELDMMQKEKDEFKNRMLMSQDSEKLKNSGAEPDVIG